MLTRLILGFRHLCERKCMPDFKDTLNPLCHCSIEAKTTTHYFLCCHFYNSNGSTLMNNLENILTSFSTVSDNNPISLPLYDDNNFDKEWKNINVNY